MSTLAKRRQLKITRERVFIPGIEVQMLAVKRKRHTRNTHALHYCMPIAAAQSIEIVNECYFYLERD